MPEILFENSPLWFVPIILVSGLLTWFYYFKKSKFSGGQRAILAFARFCTLCILGFLLLSPLLKKSDRIEEKPILIWLEDHSKSVSLNENPEVINSLYKNDELLKELTQRYQVEQLDFSEDLESAQDSFSNTKTNIELALRQVQERYYNQNVGGLVLLSDGISNEGNDPLYAVRSSSYPIFTVGIGDTTSQADLFVDRIIANPYSYLNNQFPVEIYIKARELAQQGFRLTVKDQKGEVVHSQKMEVDGKDFFERVDLYLNSSTIGLQQYSVELSPIEGEENLKNNQRYFNIDILNNQKKITIVGSGAHPDLAAIANALMVVEKYKVSSYIAADLPADTGKTDLWILHNPNAVLLKKLENSKTPFWILVGPQTPFAVLDKQHGLKLGSAEFEDVELWMNGNFNLFSLNAQESDWLNSLPPLWGTFGESRFNGVRQTLFKKKIGAINTEESSWFYAQADNRRVAYTLGVGIWKWRIWDYRANRSFENFDDLVSKTVQYLTAASQDQRFIVDIADKFSTTANIYGEARLYNSSLELTNGPELEIKISNESNEDFAFSFSRSQNTYRLNAGKLPAGVYQWSSKVALGDENFDQNGRFIVEANQIEESDLVARHYVLRALANESGGQFFNTTETEKLFSVLINNKEAKGIQRIVSRTLSIVNLKWIFGVLLLLMNLEWGLRKYFGNY